MKNIFLIVTGLCIFIAVFVSTLAIWDYVGSDVAWKTVATVSIVFIGTLAFNITNKRLGNKSSNTQ